jgi:hypothetical protein
MLHELACMFLLATVFSLIAVFSATPAQAQTAEETAAFILLGIEEGKKSQFEGETGKPISWKMDAHDFILELDRKKQRRKARLSIDRLAPCSFRIVISRLVVAESQTHQLLVVTAEFDKILSIKYHPQTGNAFDHGHARGNLHTIRRELTNPRERDIKEKECHPSRDAPETNDVLFPGPKSRLAEYVVRASTSETKTEEQAKAEERRLRKAINHFRQYCSMRVF